MHLPKIVLSAFQTCQVAVTLLFAFCLPVTRLEERESDLKKEYNALHQRHTEVSLNFPHSNDDNHHLQTCRLFDYRHILLFTVDLLKTFDLSYISLYLSNLQSLSIFLLFSCNFSWLWITDDSDVRRAHRADQTAAGGEQQPVRRSRLRTIVSHFISVSPCVGFHPSPCSLGFSRLNMLFILTLTFVCEDS